jgi:hypothetical protein
MSSESFEVRDSLRDLEEILQCPDPPMLELFDRSDAATGDLSNLTGRPTPQGSKDDDLGLIVGQLVHKYQELLEPDHGQDFLFDVGSIDCQLVNGGVEWLLNPSNTAPNLVHTARSGDGEGPGAKSPGVSLEVVDAASQIEEDISEDVLGVR